VYAQLAEQRNRRFIKTHTPLDGIPLDPRVTYIVTARHPLDMFVSLRHHLDSLGGEPARELTGRPAPPPPRGPLRESLLRWIADDDDTGTYPESLPGVMRHLSDAWVRRAEPNVLLVRYDDLCTDLEGQMRWLAARLGIAVPERVWPALVRGASFEDMRDRSDRLVAPDGAVSDRTAFFGRGSSGAGREALSDEEMASYHARAGQLAPPDMLDWLHAPARRVG